MNLQPVTGPIMTFVCCKCGTRTTNAPGREGQPQVYADLEGEPFKAYYCAECLRGEAADGVTTVARWNEAWSRDTSLWQFSTPEKARAYADAQHPIYVYVVEVRADGYRPFWGAVKSTAEFEKLTEGVEQNG